MSRKKPKAFSSREPTLGTYDCLYKEPKPREEQTSTVLRPPALPQIGKLTIHRTFVIFNSSFSQVSRKLKQRDLVRVDATSRISLILVGKETKSKRKKKKGSGEADGENNDEKNGSSATAYEIDDNVFQLQFVDNTECFERLVKKWKLEYGKAPKEVKDADEDEEDEDKTDDESVGEGIDLKRIAYKPLKVRHPRSDSTFEDGEDENEDNFGTADAFIRTIETMASKLPFGSGRKAKRATYFLRQQLKATRRMTKKTVKYAMRYVNRRSRELALARTRQAAKSAILRQVEAVDVEKEVSKTLFVRLMRAKNVLAMDDGGTSDPFTEIRFRGLQNVSKTIKKTCDPEWEQTFTFNIPNGKRVLDASDAVELYVYDRDPALNDFIGYAKLDLEGEEVQDEESMKLNRKRMSSSWKRVDSASEGGFSPTKQTKSTNGSFESDSNNESTLTSKDKKPIPPVATKIRYDKNTGRKYTQKTIHLSSLPENQQPSFFDANHLKEKLMFWEGERKFTGTITCEYWFGSRHDVEFRASAQPKLRTANNELTASIQHYCDPVTALLRVDVRAGRNIINLDCLKGEDGSEGGSDPYVEISIVDAVDKSTMKKSTHYIEDSRNPMWNRTFTFMASQPYSDTIQFKCYDYDGATSFDDVIGCYSVPLHELPVRVGVKMLPEYSWVTLRHPKTGSDKNEFGVPYGEIEIRAYIDEEYFDHLHGGNATKAVGKLSVDILEANGIDKIPQGAYCVCKIGPYWSRLETVKKTEFNGELADEGMLTLSEDEEEEKEEERVGGGGGKDGEVAKVPNPPLNDEARRAKKIAKMIENANKIQWNKRLIYPVTEPSDEIVVSVFDAENDDVIGTIKLPLSCMEDGVRYENTCTLMMNANAAIGEIVKNGTLTLAFTFTHFKGGALLARKYIKPKLPAKWYYYPLSPNETNRMVRAQKDVLVKNLLQANPPIPEKVSQHILAYSQHTVNVMSIKSSVARLEKSMSGFIKLHKGLTFTFSWESIPVTVLAQCLLVFWIYHPEWLLPSLCFGLSLNAMLLFPGRYQRVLDRMVPNEFLSVGIAAASEDIDAALKLKDQEDREKEIESKGSLLAKEFANIDSDDDSDNKENAAKVAKEAEEKKKKNMTKKEAATWDSINPIAQLQKQLEEVKLLITQSQSILDQVAGGVERFIGIFTWAEPRVTAMTILVVMALGWSTLYIQAIVRIGIELMTGVVAKVIFKIVTPERVKFACTCVLLWLLRHPAIFPDDVRRAIQEEKNARIEAQLAAEAKKANGEMNASEEADLELEEAIKEAPPKVDYLFDPRPLPPLNVFFRIPTRSSQLV